MKPIIFCNIAHMYYYKGVQAGIDEPVNGGKWVNENNDAHESNNFSLITLDNDNKNYCLGFVQHSENHIIKLEKICGLQGAKKEEEVHNVIVVWCAKARNRRTNVVGWYQNATVYRFPHICDITDDIGNEREQWYNFISEENNCVLLPYYERKSAKWYIPRVQQNSDGFGFGQSNIWYAGGFEENPKQKVFLEKLIDSIENYDGENWLYQENDR